MVVLILVSFLIKIKVLSNRDIVSEICSLGKDASSAFFGFLKNL